VDNGGILAGREETKGKIFKKNGIYSAYSGGSLLIRDNLLKISEVKRRTLLSKRPLKGGVRR